MTLQPHPRTTPPARHSHLLSAITLALALLGVLALLVAPDARAGQNTLTEVLSYEMRGCRIVIDPPDPSAPNQAPVHELILALPYTGTITEATLLLRADNVRDGSAHPILINGQDIGLTVHPEGYGICDNTNPANTREYPLPPELLHPGANSVRLSIQPGSNDSYGFTYAALRVRGPDLKYSVFQDIQFPGEGDTLVDAVVLSPTAPSTPKRPLLLLFHGWNGGPYDPFMTDYTNAVVDRDWFAVSPQQRGNMPHGQALASLRTQHDAILLINYMLAHYPIDRDRIYVGGFSMGGMAAGTLAAKYPDIFAAAVTHEAITDLRDWYYEQNEFRQTQIVTETTGTPAEVPFEYRRRSPLELARNLSNLPLAIVHGDVDTTVLPHHAQDFYSAVNAFAPVHVELQWYHGNHGEDPSPYNGEWAVHFMEPYTRTDRPTRLHIRTDESKAFYWLDLQSPRQADQWYEFTEVDATLDPASEHVYLTITDTQEINLSFDIARMGLDVDVSYVVSQTNSSQGTQPFVTALRNGRLDWTVPAGVTRLDIYPNRGLLPGTISLQQGHNYEGTTDTYLHQWSPDSNYGKSAHLLLRPGVLKTLLRFDLNGVLPNNIRLTAANLKLYDAGTGPPMTVDLYRMLHDWDETTATYNQAAGGRPWSGGPGGSSGQDWEAQPIGSFQLNRTTPGIVTAGILPALQSWAADPAQNFGLVLVPRDAAYGGQRTLSSSDHWDPAQRPELEISFEPIP
ncbi:MAG: alpha/beta fold hydrolase, partial [Caldilineae bacterium]